VKPSFWYVVPHGYLPLDLDPPVETVDALFDGVRSLPDELRGQGERMLQFYGGLLWALDAQRAQACMLGMHPTEDGEPALSVITISTVSTAGNKPELVIASMVGSATERPEDGIVPLDLPCGIGFLDEQKRRTTAPGLPRDGSGVPQEGTVWQGTVTTPGPDQNSVIVLQLVTPAIHQSEDYQNILLGVAHTLTFTDPSGSDADRPAAEAATKGSVAQAIQNDFG
jgi:hypothetical protein